MKSITGLFIVSRSDVWITALGGFIGLALGNFIYAFMSSSNRPFAIAADRTFFQCVAILLFAWMLLRRFA